MHSTGRARHCRSLGGSIEGEKKNATQIHYSTVTIHNAREGEVLPWLPVCPSLGQSVVFFVFVIIHSLVCCLLVSILLASAAAEAETVANCCFFFSLKTVGTHCHTRNGVIVVFAAFRRMLMIRLSTSFCLPMLILCEQNPDEPRVLLSPS